MPLVVLVAVLGVCVIGAVASKMFERGGGYVNFFSGKGWGRPRMDVSGSILRMGRLMGRMRCLVSYPFRNALPSHRSDLLLSAFVQSCNKVSGYAMKHGTLACRQAGTDAAFPRSRMEHSHPPGFRRPFSPQGLSTHTCANIYNDFI